LNKESKMIIGAELRKARPLYRVLRAYTAEGGFNIKYNGWRKLLCVNDQLVARPSSAWWSEQTLHFNVGTAPATLEVSAWPWLTFKSFRLKIDKQLHYGEGYPSATESFAKALGSALISLIVAIFVSLFVGISGIVSIAIMCTALMDATFVGRFGVTAVGGFVIASGIDYLLRKKWPKWHARTCTSEGVSMLSLLLYIVVGMALYLLLEDILPSLAPGTEHILSAVREFLDTLFPSSSKSLCE